MKIEFTQEKRGEIERIQREFRNNLSPNEILRATAQGIKGEFYPCKPDIFEATYTEVKASIFKELNYKVFPSEAKTIQVEDDPTYGGAHHYRAQHSTGFYNGEATYVDGYTEIRFVQKNDDGTMIPGLQSEQLAYILLDRAEKLNSRFPSPQNEKQIAGLKMFLEGCEERIRDRMDRGVMGELKK